MMDLSTQIKMLLFSFLFGAFFAFVFDLNAKFLYSRKKVFCLFFTFLFVFVNVLLYFVLLKKINEGILHIYSLLALSIGFFVEHAVKAKVVKLKK